MNAPLVTTMADIDIPMLQQIIRYVMMESDEIPMIWGQPGVGKTEGTDQAITKANALMVDLRLGQQDVVDMRGFPGVDRDPNSPTFGQMIWFPPSRLPFIGNDQYPDDRPIGLVFDEVNQGAPQVLSGAYQIMQERRYGEFILKPNVRIIAMGNRETDRGFVNRMPLPLCNRMVHYNLNVNVRAFCDYAITKGIPTWLIAFWLFRPELVNTFDPEKADKNFATPRTWFKAAKFFQAVHWPEEVRMASVIGSVGQGPAMEAVGFREIDGRVPKMREILAKPDTCDVPDEPSMQFAVSLKIAGEVNTKNCTAAYTYAKRLPPEFTVLAMTLGSKRDRSLFPHPSFIDFSQRYRQIFSPATD